MGSADRGCFQKNRPERSITDAPKASQNDVQAASADEAGDVFDEDISGSESCDCTPEFKPQSGTIALLNSLAFAGSADVLAGESTGEHIRAGDFRPVHFSDIAVDGDSWPMLSEDGAAERVALAEPDGAEASGPFEAEVDAADAGEERADGEHIQPPQIKRPIFMLRCLRRE